jgi:hypothetical protein
MKKFLKKAVILSLGFGLAMSFASCHSSGSDSVNMIEDDGSSAPELTPTHSINVTILDNNGVALNGTTLTFIPSKGNPRIATVSGNTWGREGLADGTYTIKVEKNGYVTAEETYTFTLRTETVEGKARLVAENKEATIYLAKDVPPTAPISIGGSAQVSEEITIETTTQTEVNENGDAETVNSTEEGKEQQAAATVTVQAETPAVTGTVGDTNSDLGKMDQEIKEQGGNGIEDLEVKLTNITSLEDARAVAVVNRPATSRQTRATTSLPGGLELLAGVAVNAGSFKITMPAGLYFEVNIKLPDAATMNAVQLYYTIQGDQWYALNGPNANLGVAEVNRVNNTINIKMSILRTVSFALFLPVTESAAQTSSEAVNATPIPAGAQGRTVTSMPYTVKSGVVVKNTINGPLTDFLRKIVLRKYGTRAVKAAQNVTKSYTFSPAYQMHANGTLYLAGFQNVSVKTFSIGSSAAFETTEYGDAFVYPYEVYPEPEEPVNTHSGGSSTNR